MHHSVHHSPCVSSVYVLVCVFLLISSNGNACVCVWTLGKHSHFNGNIIELTLKCAPANIILANPTTTDPHACHTMRGCCTHTYTHICIGMFIIYLFWQMLAHSPNRRSPHLLAHSAQAHKLISSCYVIDNILYIYVFGIHEL